jgi:hypothetical protein
MGKQTTAAPQRTKSTTHLAALFAARKILEAELKGFDPLPEGKHQIDNTDVVISISGAEIDKAADSETPEFATFPMDLAAAFFLRRMPAGERTQARSELFSLFEGIQRKDAQCLADQEELESTIESLKKFKKQIGMKPLKGATRVHAIGKAKVSKTA